MLSIRRYVFFCCGFDVGGVVGVGFWEWGSEIQEAVIFMGGMEVKLEGYPGAMTFTREMKTERE